MQVRAFSLWLTGHALIDLHVHYPCPENRQQKVALSEYEKQLERYRKQDEALVAHTLGIKQRFAECTILYFETHVQSQFITLSASSTGGQ